MTQAVAPTSPPHAGAHPAMNQLVPGQQGMGQNPEIQALLEQMHDIQQPEAPGLWPLAPGWWILIVLLMAALVSTIHLSIKRFKASAYRREAIQRLKQLEKHQPQTDAELVRNLFALLKQTSLTAYPMSRQQIANLHSKAWLKFLDKTQKAYFFDSPLGDLMLKALYQNGNIGANDKSKCFEITKKWISNHKRLNAQKLSALLRPEEKQTTSTVKKEKATDAKVSSAEVEHVPA